MTILFIVHAIVSDSVWWVLPLVINVLAISAEYEYCNTDEPIFYFMTYKSLMNDYPKPNKYKVIFKIICKYLILDVYLIYFKILFIIRKLKKRHERK